MIETEEILQINADSIINDTMQMNNICDINNKIQSSLTDPTVNFSDEKFLEITKNLKDRDISLYEYIFFSNDEEEFLQVEQKNTDSHIHNQQNITNISTIKNDRNLINDGKSLENMSNILNSTLPKNIFIDNKKNNCSIDNEAKLTTDKLLQAEKNLCIKENNDNIFESSKTVSDESNKLPSTEFGIECTLPIEETKGINKGDPVIMNQMHLNSNNELLKSNNFEKSYKTIESSVSNDVQTNNNKKMPLENIKVDACTAETQSSEIIDKTISGKGPNIISKLQNMNWLKTRSSYDIINTSYIPKVPLKSLPKKDEHNKYYIPKYDNSHNKHRSNDTEKNRNHNDIFDVSKQNNTQQPNVAPTKNTWSNNNNSTKEHFPNTQSLVINKTKEAEELNVASSESICSSQQENLKCKISAKCLKANTQDDTNNNYRKETQKNFPDNLSEVTVSSSCDENQAKDFIDKLGQDDGYSEKRLFIGKGARKKEQDLIKAHSENKYKLQNNQGFHQSQSLIRKLPIEPNSYEKQKEEIKNQCDSYTETVLPNRNQERFMHGKFIKEFDCPKADLLINKHDQKSVYNQTTSKYLNHNCKEESLKPNQDYVYRNQNNKGKSQSYSYQNQNFLTRGQEYTVNQEHNSRYQNYYDGYQEYTNRNQEPLNKHQNYSDKNYDNVMKRQDFLYRNPNYDRSQDTAIKYKGYFNKNQEYFNRYKNCTDNYNRNINDLNKHPKYTNTAKRRFSKCSNDEHWMNRNNLTFQKYSDNNNQQEYNQWKTMNQMQETKFTNSYDQHKNSQCQEDQINIDNKVDTVVHKDVKQEKQCANYNSPNQEFSENWTKSHALTDSNSNHTFNILNNPNISRMQNHPTNQPKSTSEVKIKKEAKQNFLIPETCTSLRIREPKSSHNFDEHENVNYQESQVNIDNKINTVVQKDVQQEKQNANINLPKQELPDNWAMPHVLTDSNLDRAIDILKKTNISNTQNHSMNQTTPISDTKKLNNTKQIIPETKTTLTPETSTNLKGVQEGLSSDPTSHSITFENNQNIQCAPGLNPRVCNTPQNTNLKTVANDVASCFSEIVNDNTVALTYLDQSGQTYLEQGDKFHQDMPCVGYEAPTRIHQNAVMNVNAMPFIAANSQGLVSQVPEPPNAAFNVFPNEQQQQIGMNEVSNSSQNLLSLHNTVCSLSKQLASAQADLLAAQVKFYQDTVSCSTNTHNQLPMQSQNHSLVTDIHSTKYSNQPGIQPPIPSVQKIQNEAYVLPKNYPTHNVQEFPPKSYHANATIEPGLDLQPMYNQPNHFYQQQHPNYQQYYLNAQPTNSIARGKIQGHSEGKES